MLFHQEASFFTFDIGISGTHTALDPVFVVTFGENRIFVNAIERERVEECLICFRIVIIGILEETGRI